MSINVPREVDVIKSFKKRKILVNVLQYIAIVGVAIAIFALGHRDPTLTGLPFTIEVILGAMIFIAACVAFFLTWKCPACKKSLGINTRVSACRKCSTVFEGEKHR
jgi:hypothetical protein